MKTKIFTILGYVALVVVVLLMSQCESRVTLTTPKKDAQHIIALAQGVESEEELKSVEKLARKYEIAYEHMYNGAKALEFKRLTNDALREASYVCDQIHADNERLCELQATFSGSLADLDGAWSRNTASKEADMATIRENDARIEAIKEKIESAEADILAYSERLIDAGYPADMLEELGKMKETITEYEAQIAAIENESRIIRLAYKLQGVEFIEVEPEVETCVAE